MRPITKEQTDSIESVFKTNNYHIAVFKEWLEDSYQDYIDIILNPNSTNEERLRYSSSALVLKDILTQITY